MATKKALDVLPPDPHPLELNDRNISDIEDEETNSGNPDGSVLGGLYACGDPIVWNTDRSGLVGGTNILDAIYKSAYLLFILINGKWADVLVNMNYSRRVTNQRRE